MGDDDQELQDIGNSQSPDGGRDRKNGSRSGKPRSSRNRQPRDTDYFIRYAIPVLLLIFFFFKCYSLCVDSLANVMIG